MINEKQAKKYCGEDISLIENYAQAVSDKTQTWVMHHKLEIMPWGTYSIKNLKDNGLYYKQPAAITHEYETAATNSYFGVIHTREWRRSVITVCPTNSVHEK